MADKLPTVRQRRVPFSFIWRGSMRQRLWRGGAAIALFVVTLIVAHQSGARQSTGAADAIGLDFIAFYTAGAFVDQGRSADLYDLDSKRAFQRDLAAGIGLDIESKLGPWWNPPFYAWVFVPFARMPFVSATLAWTVLNIVMVCVAVALLGRALLADGRSSDRWLAGVLTVISMPFIGMVSHAQNTGMSLLLLTLTVLAWRARRALLAGLLCGLLLYKPQLGALVAGMLVLTLGVRALVGLMCTGAALAAVAVTTLPGALGDFLARMPANLAYAQEQSVYIWDRHATVKAFWRLLLQGYELGPASWMVNGLTIVCSGGLAVLLVVAAVRWRSRRDAARLDRLIAATIVAMPLIMPFYFDYDLLLLVIPAVLLARDGLPCRAVPRWLIAGWAGLYAWMYINAPVAEATRVNGTVLLLAAVAWMMMGRAWRVVEEPRAKNDEAAVVPPVGCLQVAGQVI